MNPHRVTQDFERALCEYTGAPYAVAVNSCTMAILLAVKWNIRNEHTFQEAGMHNGPGWKEIKVPLIEIPRKTYISVPMSIIHAGGRPTFRDDDWKGWYRLTPLPVWDSARYFSQGMYEGGALLDRPAGRPLAAGGMICVSFHASKTLGLEQGGAILHDNPEADAWLRRARFDGRTEGVAPKDDKFTQIGFHAYMNPSTAAQGILRLHSLPRHNAPLENDSYPDLSQMEIFR